MFVNPLLLLVIGNLIEPFIFNDDELLPKVIDPVVRPVPIFNVPAPVGPMLKIPFDVVYKLIVLVEGVVVL